VKCKFHLLISKSVDHKQQLKFCGKRRAADGLSSRSSRGTCKPRRDV
jgi:hypothetical protein